MVERVEMGISFIGLNLIKQPGCHNYDDYRNNGYYFRGFRPCAVGRTAVFHRLGQFVRGSDLRDQAGEGNRTPAVISAFMRRE